MRKRILISAGVRWWNASAHYAVDLARSLARRHEVLMAVRKGTPAEEMARRAGLDVDDRFDFRPPSILTDLRRMAGLLRARRFDVLNPHRAGDQNVMLLAARLARVDVPVIRTRVDVKEFRPHRVNMWAYRHLQGIVAPAEVSRQLIVEHYHVPPARVETVRGGVDVDQFRPTRRSLPLRRALGIPDDRLAVGLVARLSRIKGHRMFFDAIARLRSRLPVEPVWLVIGPEREYSIEGLRAEAAEIGAPEIRFTGFREDIADVAACLDLGVVTSLGSEAHCRVGLELMASGVVVVGTRVGVVPELIVDGETGYLVEPGDGAALADRLGQLLLDDAGRRRMSDRALEVCRAEFSLEALADRTEQALRRLLAWPQPEGVRGPREAPEALAVDPVREGA